MSAYSDSFEGFWAVYPRKINKKNASKAWEKLDADEQLAARQDVEKRNRMKAWSGDPRLIPHAATYLNAARWEDDWQQDFVLRSEAAPSPAPRQYRTVEDTHVDKWKALGNRIGMRYIRASCGIPNDKVDEFTKILNETVEEGRMLDSEEDKREAVMTFAKLLVSRLDKALGLTNYRKVIGNA